MSFAMERVVVPKGRRSARLPRNGLWGVQILHPDQQNVQQVSFFGELWMCVCVADRLCTLVLQPPVAC